MNQPVASHPTRYWHALPDGRVQCDVCPRFCKLHEGQRGLCLVRARQGGQIVLTTYGRSSGFCIDPIEKKPLNHFLPGTPVLSFGTAGCNLTCKFCQNWDISKARDLDRIQDMASPEAIADAAVRSGCRSVAFTYNDPVIFLEYAVDVARTCRERGLKTVAVSAGFIAPEPRIEFFRYMDAANIDLKGFTDKFYKDLCSGKLAAVLETLKYLKHETKVWFEITTLLIPGENDSPAEIEAESAWLIKHLGPDVPLHFTAFTIREGNRLFVTAAARCWSAVIGMTSPGGICLRAVAASLAALRVMASLRRARGAGVRAVCLSSRARQCYIRR